MTQPEVAEPTTDQRQASRAARRAERRRGRQVEGDDALGAAGAEAGQEVAGDHDRLDRLDALEHQLRAVTATLRTVVDRQRSEAQRWRQADEVTRSRLHAAVLQGLAELRATNELPSELDDAVANGLAQVKFEVASLEERMHGSVVALTEMMETQRSDLEALVQRRVVRTSPRPAVDLQARVERLGASVTEEAQRVRALEDQLQRLEARIADLPAALRAEPAPPAGPARQPATITPLVDDLERQLQEADRRLSQRSATTVEADG